MGICEALGIKGPSCIQLKRDSQGCLRLTDVNPKIGGATIFSTLAGANIPSYCIDLVDGNDIKVPTLRSIYVLRYFQEIPIESDYQC